MEQDESATCLPSLHQSLHEKFGGPHTQFAGGCYVVEADGTMVSVIVVMSCTQVFICDVNGFVVRSMLIQRLVSIYQHRISSDEQEIMLVFDREHDLLLRGALVCDGQPAKPLIATIRALHTAHHPNIPLVVHMDCPSPLKELAKLKPPPGYVAPLPMKEDTFENCPCWRPADVLNISNDEFTRRVRNMFIVYAPEKLPTVNELCRKYQRKKGGAIHYLVGKYGPEPTDEHAKAVLAVHERERKFAELLKSPADEDGQDEDGETGRPGGVVPLSAVTKAQKKKLSDDQGVFFSTLLLAKQPSGGHGRIQLRVTPIPYMLLQQAFQPFKRRELDQQREFWYMCNEGCVLSFDISDHATASFGYRHGDRVLSTWGVTRSKWSTIVGVRDGCLWVHDDGEMGAAALAGFKSRDELERLNGWMLSENVRMKPVTKMPMLTSEGRVIGLNVTPEVVFERFGFYHGEKVECTSPCSNPMGGWALVVGVDEDTGLLYAIFVNSNSTRGDANSNGGATGSSAKQMHHSSQASMFGGGGGGAMHANAADNINNQSNPADSTTATASTTRNNNTSTGTGEVPGAMTAIATPLQRCLNKDDVVRRYGWQVTGTDKIYAYSGSNTASSMTALGASSSIVS